MQLNELSLDETTVVGYESEKALPAEDAKE